MCAAKPAVRAARRQTHLGITLFETHRVGGAQTRPRRTRESTRASRRAESNAISASDDEKLEMLEDTLIALKTRVAALACLNEDAARETTNAVANDDCILQHSRRGAGKILN